MSLITQLDSVKPFHTPDGGEVGDELPQTPPTAEGVLQPRTVLHLERDPDLWRTQEHENATQTHTSVSKSFFGCW